MPIELNLCINKSRVTLKYSSRRPSWDPREVGCFTLMMQKCTRRRYNVINCRYRVKDAGQIEVANGVKYLVNGDDV